MDKDFSKKEFDEITKDSNFNKNDSMKFRKKTGGLETRTCISKMLIIGSDDKPIGLVCQWA